MTLSSFFAGIGLRTATPSFESGDEIAAFVTDTEGGVQIARVGDTKLRLSDAPDDLIDKRVRLRVTEFDDDSHVGEAEYLETVGESAF